MDAHEPYLSFRDERDLLLVSQRFTGRPRQVRLPQAYYGEITAWATIKISSDDVFSPSGRLIFAGRTGTGVGWRLYLDAFGYLSFETDEEGGFKFRGWLPVHSYFDRTRVIRLGLSLHNAPSPALLDHLNGRKRLTPSAVEYYSNYDFSSRLSLLVGVGENGPLLSCGDAKRLQSPLLQAVPETVHFSGLPPFEALRGQVLAFTAYQTERYDMVGDRTLKSARSVFPDTPGGGAFAPKWIDDETVQFWPMPEFCSSSGFWMYARVEDPSGRLRRLRVNPRAARFSMMPTFFIRTGRSGWRRIAPEALRMGWDGTEFGFDLRLTPREAKGCWVSCAIPFLESDRAELIEWAAGRLGASVECIGKSVLGRPIELIRVGADNPEMRIALLFGQHSPMEIMAAHLIRPLLAEAHGLGLLERVEFHIVPTVNVDCAHYGGNGLNANRLNTNRHWFDGLQPETAACIDYFDRMREQGDGLDFALDFHAGGTFRNHLIFYPDRAVGSPAPRGVMGRITPWREALERHAGFRRCDSRPTTLVQLMAKDYFIRRCRCPALTVELSTTSYFDPEEGVIRPFSTGMFDVVGRGIARAVAALLGCHRQ